MKERETRCVDLCAWERKKDVDEWMKERVSAAWKVESEWGEWLFYRGCYSARDRECLWMWESSSKASEINIKNEECKKKKKLKLKCKWMNRTDRIGINRAKVFLFEHFFRFICIFFRLLEFFFFTFCQHGFTPKFFFVFYKKKILCRVMFCSLLFIVFANTSISLIASILFY